VFTCGIHHYNTLTSVVVAVVAVDDVDDDDERTDESHAYTLATTPSASI